MNQFNEHIDPIKPITRANKNFVYKRMKYPVDFSLVKKYSNYFYNNKSQFKLIHDIELKLDNYEVPEEVIPVFIACCQNQPFDINDTNVFSLHQLSIQYDVPLLNNLTSQCLRNNKKSLVYQSILFKLQFQNSKANIDLSSEENIIASNFFDYINDDQLISLPISVLYRIINNEQIKLNSMNQTNQNQYIEFLFKCLDKHQRKASVLFLNLDLENERIDILSQLFTHYSNIFDFNLINSKFLSKSTSFLLNELNKLKIEFIQKFSEIESENKKQKEFFNSSLDSFNNSKNELVNLNHSLEERIQKLEGENEQQKNKLNRMKEKLDLQATQLERYTNLKVNKIEIFSEPKFLLVNSTIKLSTIVKPKLAFNDDVEWQIIQEVEGSVEINSMNEKTIVLKGLKQANKVTVIAKALDGSGVTASKEIMFSFLKGTIEVNVQQNQMIKGIIKVEEFGAEKLDTSRSKYILNTNSSPVLGENAYESGEKLDRLVKEVFFVKPKGEYYLHVLIINGTGSSQELISQLLKTAGGQYEFKSKGSVESVELEPGRYKLEAWGAQGGSYNSTYYGGYGGYSTGTINLQSKTTLYVVVGKSTNSTSGGYNGGGCGGIYKRSYTFTSYGGCGASHIGLKPGELTAFSNDYSSNLLIVASGGGGATGKNGQNDFEHNSIGGCGGGCNGAVGKCKELDRAATGATQSSGGKCGSFSSDWKECGTFGHGGNSGNHPGNRLGGGGGSGFYGGGSGANSGPGGGGSGYINTSKLENASMYGFEVPQESITFPATNFSSDAISNNAKQGDGYVKITPV